MRDVALCGAIALLERVAPWAYTAMAKSRRKCSKLFFMGERAEVYRYMRGSMVRASGDPSSSGRLCAQRNPPRSGGRT
ncbi:MAG: hypothetical protein ACREPW_02480 [Candidatus Binataceae bacterium]